MMHPGPHTGQVCLLLEHQNLPAGGSAHERCGRLRPGTPAAICDLVVVDRAGDEPTGHDSPGDRP